MNRRTFFKQIAATVATVVAAVVVPSMLVKEPKKKLNKNTQYEQALDMWETTFKTFQTHQDRRKKQIERIYPDIIKQYEFNSSGGKR